MTQDTFKTEGLSLTQAEEMEYRARELLAKELPEGLAADVRAGNIRYQWAADAIRAIVAALSQQPAVDGCHCGTCTCNPNMTPAVRFDLSPVQQERAIREHLIRLGWTPPVGATEDMVLDAIERRESSTPAAAHEPCAAVAAIQFALSDPEGMTFLRLWNEGEFDTLRREWPDALRKIYNSADPLA